MRYRLRPWMCRLICAGFLLALPALNGAGTTARAEPRPDAGQVVLGDLGWIAGCWIGDQGGGRTEECWMPPAGGMMLGLHRDLGPDGTLRGFEYLRIVADEQGIVYLASPQGRPPTPFRLLEASSGRVVFSNQEHDFPQRIIYALEDGALHARIEGLVDGKLRAMEWSWRPADLSDLTAPPDADAREPGDRAESAPVR